MEPDKSDPAEWQWPVAPKRVENVRVWYDSKGRPSFERTVVREQIAEFKCKFGDEVERP